MEIKAPTEVKAGRLNEFTLKLPSATSNVKLSFEGNVDHFLVGEKLLVVPHAGCRSFKVTAFYVDFETKDFGIHIQEFKLVEEPEHRKPSALPTPPVDLFTHGIIRKRIEASVTELDTLSSGEIRTIMRNIVQDALSEAKSKNNSSDETDWSNWYRKIITLQNKIETREELILFWSDVSKSLNP